jgi:parallel beta-helix repeat protein
MASEDVKADTDWPEGPITKNTVWTLKGSPYIVDGMVTVEEDVKLTIKPGVEVYFNSEDDANYAEYGIAVQGELNAKDVLFTKHPDNTQDTAWAGISFEGTSDIDFESNEVSSAQIGIYIVDSYDITISNSKVTGCLDAGILVDYGSTQSYEIDILGSTIKANLNAGVVFHSVYDSQISDCDVSENIVTNVLLDSIGKGIITHDILLSDNLIQSYESTWYFTSNGIEIYGASDIVIEECTILENNQFGIYVSDSELTVSETEIAYSTHHYGIFAWSTQLTLLGNNFHDNGHSLWAAGGCAVFSSGNSFKDDYKSVVVYHSRLYMEYDNIIKVMHGVSAYYDTSVTIYDCVLKGSVDSGVGIMLSEAVKLRVTESKISDFFYGVMVGNTPETYIKDNVFVHNRNVAISVGTNFMDITVNIESNLINQGGGGIFIGGGLFNVHCTGEIIKDNIINNVEYGIWVNYCTIPIENNQVNHASLYGIQIKTASPSVRNNVVRNSFIGIYVEWWSYPEIFQNNINNCQWGIYVGFMSEAYIAGNRISVGNVGIVCDAGCYISARLNYIRGMRYQGIVVYLGSADISNNVIRNCMEGIYFYRSFGSVTGNVITHCDVGLVVHSSKVSIKSNTFRKNKTDIRFIT